MYKPNFTITESILSQMMEIAEIRAIVERSRVLPLNEAQLRRQAIVRMAHTSTSIEGNKLAEYQVDKVLSGIAVNADARSILEVKNYQLAMQKVEELSDKPLTINMILDLHSILMKGLLPPEKAGHFRKGPIYVVDDLGDGREKLRFEGPPPEKVPFLINELLTWVEKSKKESIHPVLKAGVFHLQFVTIHPFSDGNGRMTRLLSSLILKKEAFDFRKIIVLEDYYNRNRQGYYNALNEVQGSKYHEGQDLTPWLEYFILGFVVEARKVSEAISSIGFAKTTEPESQVFLDSDEIKIMDFLSTVGKVTSNDVMEILPIAKRTAQLKLKGLVDKKLITSQGNGPSTYYILQA